MKNKQYHKTFEESKLGGHIPRDSISQANHAATKLVLIKGH